MASKFPLLIRLKLFKYIVSLTFILIIIGIIYANYNLYYQSELKKYNGVLIDQDLLKQLNYLGESLDRGIAHEMQLKYPEGLFFSYLMYGLSWCELAKDLPEESSFKKKAIKESMMALVNLESDYCQRNFPKGLSLPNGAFYFSWTNYLRAKILLLSDNFSTRDKHISDFNFNCDTLSKAILDSDSPFFESYSNQFWPADILPGIASLSIHDILFNTIYDTVITHWFNKVESKQEPGEIIFPHSVNDKGIARQSARGSSLGLILILLKEISEINSGGIYVLYNRAYRTSFFNLPMLQEYSGNNSGEEDVDSGPVICGYGSVATIIGAGVFKRYGELDLAERLNQTIECAGYPYENSDTKKYLLGKVPMADFFIAWVKSLKTLEYKTVNTNVNENWRLTFQITSFILISIIVVLLLKINIRKSIIGK